MLFLIVDVPLVVPEEIPNGETYHPLFNIPVVLLKKGEQVQVMGVLHALKQHISDCTLQRAGGARVGVMSSTKKKLSIHHPVVFPSSPLTSMSIHGKREPGGEMIGVLPRTKKAWTHESKLHIDSLEKSFTPQTTFKLGKFSFA
ncbi:hypothetical protein, unlikely [Trypanosoma congolense IL3000]|uniref:Uncharacterized protein n=1 Tax=Trypanosoma congolense (strain IL3000) TaxID=1068625 RepID=F9W7M0_TRYCI|nr:hypothetical protein, unlikely [Trypanosoma congolense IL3000]